LAAPKPSQLAKFKEAARSHKADQSEKRFNQVLKGVAKSSAPSKKDTKRK
jgi:hypothetical protein